MHWVTRLDGGPCRVNHAAVAFDRQIFSFGGYCSQDDFEQRRPIDIHVLNTDTNRWTPLVCPKEGTLQYAECPYQRYGHTVVAHGRYAFVWGGRNDCDGASNTLHRFDMVTHEWKIIGNESEIIPAARDGHSACVINDMMVVFGGFEDDFQRFSQETFAFDFNTECWCELNTRGPPPAWRDFHTATPIGNYMYIFGGRSDALGQFHSNREVYHDRLMYLNMTDLTWYQPVTSGEAPTGRRSHSAWARNGRLYVFGGFCGTKNMHFDTLHEYAPTTKTWRQCAVHGRARPNARRRHVTVLIGDRLYLFGGTCPMPSHMQTSPPHLPPSITGDRGLMDLTDLYILDYEPSLATLCLMAVIESRLHESHVLPDCVRVDLRSIVEPNKITVAECRTPLQG